MPKKGSKGTGGARPSRNNLSTLYNAARAGVALYRTATRMRNRLRGGSTGTRTLRRKYTAFSHANSVSGKRSKSRIGPKRLRKKPRTSAICQITRQHTNHFKGQAGYIHRQVLGDAWTGYDLAKGWGQLVSNQPPVKEGGVTTLDHLRMLPRTHLGRHVISNQSNNVVYYRILDLVCRRDIYIDGHGEGTTRPANIINPIDYYDHGFNEQNGSSSNTNARLQLATKMTQVALFNANFKVKRVRKGVLEPGASIHHNVFRTTRKVIKYEDIRGSVDNVGEKAIAGLTGFSILEIWGGPLMFKDGSQNVLTTTSPPACCVVSSEVFTHCMEITYPKFNAYEDSFPTYTTGGKVMVEQAVDAMKLIHDEL